MIDIRTSVATPCPFGKYELLERIGTGGMAEVYRARLPGIGGFEKVVVIKRLHPHLLSDRDMVQMFVDEAKLAAQVHHKNVVQVYELDQLPSGDYYMVLEYVQGIDLRRLLQHSRRTLKRVPPWLSVHVAIEVLDALVFAHDLTDADGRRRNVVHRDVSPDNIFISDLGDIKLGDFGVARDDTRPEPLRGQIKGKISYMAPEQLAGQPIDQRYDVFAVGVVLWESLTQRPLFRGQTAAESMGLVCSGPRLPPSQFAQKIPRALDACVLRALEGDVRKRISTTREMQSMLLDVMPLLAQNVGPLEVRAQMEFLLNDEITVPTFSTPSTPRARAKQDSEPLEITDDLIVDVDEAAEDEPKTEETASNPDSWDGTYAIINPRLRGDRTDRPQAQGVETDDLVCRHLVYEIPMPGGPGVVETGDIIKKNKARTPSSVQKEAPAPFPGEPEVATVAPAPVSSLAGPWSGKALPPRADGDPNPSGSNRGPWPNDLVSDPTPATGLKVWEPYRGEHPFWMRSLKQDGFGPVGLDDVISMVHSRIPDGARRTMEISPDGQSWMPLARFSELVELHRVEHEGHIPEGAHWGLIESTGIVPLFGRIAERRHTGRLIVINQQAAPVESIEVHLVDGAPTRVGTSDRRRCTPLQMVAQKLLEPVMLEACVHEVLRSGRTLEAIVRDRYGADVRPHRARFMVGRLEPLMVWPSSTFALSTTSPAESEPFAPSILALLPPLVHRTKTVEELRALLGSMLDAEVQRAESFDAIVSQFGLSAAQTAGIHPLGQTRTIEEALKSSISGQKFALTMAYILVHLGALRPLAPVQMV